MFEVFVSGQLFLRKLEAPLEDSALFNADLNITERLPSGGSFLKLCTDKYRL
jgi:hypothetical protein